MSFPRPTTLASLAILVHGGVFGPPAPTGPTPGNWNWGPAAGQPLAASTVSTGGETDARGDWWNWWERNRFDYLVPRRAWNAAPTTGADDFLAERIARRLSQSLLSHREEVVRDRVRPLLERGLDDPDYNVRSSALIAGGRLLGAASVSAARAALRDAHAQVRDAAVLALGASASEEGVALLAALALDEPLGRAATGEGRVEVRTRAVALIALGVASARGGPGTVLEVAPKILLDRDANRRLELGTAAAAALGIAGKAAAVPRLVPIAADPKEIAEVRARALAALGAIEDGAGRGAIERALEERDERVRGAAAIALGTLARPGDEDAAARLARLVVEEESPFVSGFARIALGQVGGPLARETLLREVVRGRIQDRSFAAVGLALAIRDTLDESARERLRAAFESPGSPDRRTAFALALSLAGGVQGSERVVATFRRAKDLRTRSELPEAFALVKDGEGREALLASLEKEGNAFARGRSTFALGFFCDPHDVAPMGAAMGANRVSSWMGLYSLGLGFHGSDSALVELLRIAEDGKASAVSRAAAIDGIAIALDEDPIPTLHRLARASNYLADPGFIHEILAFTL